MMPTLKTLHTAVAAGLIGLAALPAAAGDVIAGTLTISDAWSRPGIPNRPAAAYALIENAGEADRLVAASSPAFETIELHTVEKDGDVMKMMKVDAIDAPAGGAVALEPGGFHLMLFGAEKVMAAGDSFPVTLTFEEAGEVEITVSVERRTGGGMGHGSMDHGEGHGMGSEN